MEAATTETGLGVLAITHYTRLLEVLHPDHMHILSRGRIVVSGGPELAEQLERTGYAGWAEEPEEGADDGRQVPRGGRSGRRSTTRSAVRVRARPTIRLPTLSADASADPSADRRSPPSEAGPAGITRLYYTPSPGQCGVT